MPKSNQSPGLSHVEPKSEISKKWLSLESQKSVLGEPGGPSQVGICWDAFLSHAGHSEYRRRNLRDPKQHSWECVTNSPG